MSTVLISASSLRPDENKPEKQPSGMTLDVKGGTEGLA
jgi:hypothetical protein